MELPNRLREAIEDAHGALRTNSQHELSPFYRQAIYQALGYPGSPRARKVLGNHSLLTARWVEPIWYKGQPGNYLVEQLLSLAEVVLRGEVPTEVVQEEIAKALAHLDDLGTHQEPTSSDAISAFYAASAAVGALSDCHYTTEPFSGIELDEHSANSDLDSEEYDSAGWAAVAYAHGYGIWDLRLDPAKSKEFWEWWLLEAMPQAWHLGTEK